MGVPRAVTAAPAEKTKLYKVHFEWGNESYYNNDPGVTSISINVVDAADKFEALKAAWDQIKSIVNGVEPKKMNVEHKEVCS